MSTVADYGFPPWPSPAALRAAGVSGVVRYVAGGSDSKHITAAEYKALRGAGLDVALVWEDAARTLAGSFDAAGAAREALAAAEALGYTGPIYWAADWNVTSAQWPQVRDNLRAVAGVLTVARTGLYSSYDAIGWAARDGVASRFWQSMSTAFSGGRNKNPHPATHLWQRRGVSIGGAGVDLNDVLKPEWNQTEDGMTQDEFNALMKGFLTSPTAYWLGAAIRDTSLYASDGRAGNIGQLFKALRNVIGGKGSDTGDDAAWSLADAKTAIAALGGASGGLTDADRAAIQKLTEAVEALTQQLPAAGGLTADQVTGAMRQALGQAATAVAVATGAGAGATS